MSADQALARLADHRHRLAERLAEVVTLGRDVAATVLDYARSRNVTRILIGKTEKPRRSCSSVRSWTTWIEQSGDIDVYVVRGEGEPASTIARLRLRPDSSRAVPHLAGLVIVRLLGRSPSLRSVVSAAEANVVMVFLAAVALVAAIRPRPSILASVFAVVTWISSPRLTLPSPWPIRSTSFTCSSSCSPSFC
ncbi:MAG: hypothetical protein U0790_06830 [Isosphaeraceae bacterium]